VARLNIEDSLFREDGFLSLVELTGNKYIAIGMLVSAFSLAQKYWISHGYIPKDEWTESLEAVVSVRLAVASDNGVYVKGSKEQFSWLQQKHDAGKKGGLSKSDKKLNALANNRKNIKAKLKQNQSENESDRNALKPLTLTLTPSLSPSLSQNSNSDSNNSCNEVQNKNKISKEETAQNVKIREAFFDAYRLRYGIDPNYNYKLNIQISQLRKDVGFETALELVRFYLKHNDSWYLKNTHEFGLCLKNANTLRTQMLRDQPITSIQIKNFEKTSNLVQLAKDAEAGGF
jgi:hypothetical protein